MSCVALDTPSVDTPSVDMPSVGTPSVDRVALDCSGHPVTVLLVYQLKDEGPTYKGWGSTYKGWGPTYKGWAQRTKAGVLHTKAMYCLLLLKAPLLAHFCALVAVAVYAVQIASLSVWWLASPLA